MRGIFRISCVLLVLPSSLAFDLGELVSHRIAWRPIPADGFPSVGGIEDVAGYYEAVTHSGITLGPIIGRCIAKEITQERIESLISPYRPDRFPTSDSGGAP
jgi:glycine/D-amino acid oxidase-like deaminating enzyme